ncbi:MAG: 50S ribosomal protein L22 [Acholeplasmatales bacterium]|jgi:large subunit ribosomal protein L22|nr:50S ribosomal protein L22 [Acholeplasmatales bacterium]MBQ6783603.1 50S ribosomal protein L22 [Acholeplasmatales bacterium]MBR6288886.1 50S ribosomal protein L22 [Acholeplasmatales bacterium]
MEAKAIAKNVKCTPRKARLVVDLIRNKDVAEAQAILKLTNKQVTEDVLKVLNSAIANAEHNNNMDVNNLYVKTAYVNDGLRMKRMLPRAKGRGDVIIKRFSNITIIVAEKESK